jgi:hypothetical protein
MQKKLIYYAQKFLPCANRAWRPMTQRWCCWQERSASRSKFPEQIFLCVQTGSVLQDSRGRRHPGIRGAEMLKVNCKNSIGTHLIAACNSSFLVRCVGKCLNEERFVAKFITDFFLQKSESLALVECEQLTLGDVWLKICDALDINVKLWIFKSLIKTQVMYWFSWKSFKILTYNSGKAVILPEVFLNVYIKLH